MERDPAEQNTAVGAIGLVGGDEFRGRGDAVDRALLGLAPRTPPSLAILPTAAFHENPELAAANGLAHFQRLGAQPYAVMILDRATANDESLVSELRKADLVYLSGGSPTHLLDSLRGSRAWDSLVEMWQRGVVIAGSSAGAMVLCQKMLYRDHLLDGLGLIRRVAVVPHFENSSPGSIERLQSAIPADLTLLGTDSATGSVGIGSQWQVVGAGRVTIITKSSSLSLPAGKKFDLT